MIFFSLVYLSLSGFNLFFFNFYLFFFSSFISVGSFGNVSFYFFFFFSFTSPLISVKDIEPACWQCLSSSLVNDIISHSTIFTYTHARTSGQNDESELC